MRSGVLVLASLLAQIACDSGSDPVIGPDGGQAPGATIVMSPSHAGEKVTLPWTQDGITVETIALHVARITLVGDVGAGERTTVRDRSVALQGDVRIDLPDAPPGLYSRVRLELGHVEGGEGGEGGGSVRVGSDGRLRVESEDEFSLRLTGKLADGRTFVATSEEGLEVDVRAGDGLDLAPGAHLVAHLGLDFARWLAVANPVAGEGDPVEIDLDEDLVHEALEQAFAESASLTLGL